MIHSRLIKPVKLFLHITLVLCFATQACAQTLLDKRICIHISHERLKDALGKISQKGGFYFSYNSNILPKDSLVSIAANNQPLRIVLPQVLGEQYEYGEQKIINPAS